MTLETGPDKPDNIAGPLGKPMAAGGDGLWLKVIYGLILGVVVGLILGPDVNIIGHFMGGDATVPKTDAYLEARLLAEQIGGWLSLPGNLFITLIRFVVIPLVIASVALGICGGKDAAAIKKIGGSVMVYFLITTTVAVIIGVVIAQVISPGDYIGRTLADMAQLDSMAPGLSGGETTVPQAIVGILPTNPFEAMAQGQMLQIVIASIIFGLALLMIPKTESIALIDLLASVQSACLAIVNWLMTFAPIAVFGLLASVMIKVGASALAGLAAYMFTFLLVLLALLTFYMLVLKFFSGRSPLEFIRRAREPFLIAFSTSSSSATMPVTLKTVEGKMGIHPTVARLVVPVGATVNLDGTAAYQAVAVLFLAQVFGVEMSTADLFTLLTLSIAASIGAPGVPGGSIPILITILVSVGIPPEGIALILSVDRILDMARTAVNVTGDMVTCTVMERITGLRGTLPVAEPEAESSDRSRP